jgi:hypothetical protein
MGAIPRQISVLALGVALALPQGAAAQSQTLPNQPTGLGNAGVHDGIAPDSSNLSRSSSAIGDDGSARDVTGQLQPVAANPYATFNYDADVTYSQADGTQQSALRRETPAEQAGRNDGSTSSGGDQYNSTRGKTTTKPNRLGAVDQGSGDKRKLSIKPYIEAEQVVQGYLSPRSEPVTYSVFAVGADANINGRNNQGVISARYERRIGWTQKDDGRGVTGVARLSTSIVPDAVRMDYGGFANRTYVTTSGAALGTGSVGSDALTQVYAVYAGPTVTAQHGDVAFTGHYHVGYTHVGSTATATGVSSIATSTLDHSTVQDAKIAVGTRAGEALPVGLGVDAGLYEEDVSNLAQRVNDKHVRGEVIIPVTEAVSLVGGVGYEHVQVSSHNAVVDSTGAPVIDASGLMITDYGTPRYIAYDAEGLIWDAGVVWRPGRRTNFELHVGHRYGETGAYGFFNYQPSDRSSLNVVLYDGVTGFGGALTNSLFNLPTQFSPIRDAITGNLSNCVSSMSGGNCLASATGSVNSTIYRSRGFSASYSLELGRVRTGFGFGYDRRRYVTAQETVLASINGKVDQYYWLAAFLGYHLTQHSTFDTTLDAYKYQSGLSSTGDLNAVRAVGLYQYYLSRHLTANASLAIDGITRQAVDDLWSAAGSVGMRYTF